MGTGGVCGCGGGAPTYAGRAGRVAPADLGITASPGYCSGEQLPLICVQIGSAEALRVLLDFGACQFGSCPASERVEPCLCKTCIFEAFQFTPLQKTSPSSNPVLVL